MIKKIIGITGMCVAAMAMACCGMMCYNAFIKYLTASCFESVEQDFAKYGMQNLVRELSQGTSDEWFWMTFITFMLAIALLIVVASQLGFYINQVVNHNNEAEDAE